PLRHPARRPPCAERRSAVTASAIGAPEVGNRWTAEGRPRAMVNVRFVVAVLALGVAVLGCSNDKPTTSEAGSESSASTLVCQGGPGEACRARTCEGDAATGALVAGMIDPSPPVGGGDLRKVPFPPHPGPVAEVVNSQRTNHVDVDSERGERAIGVAGIALG